MSAIIAPKSRPSIAETIKPRLDFVPVNTAKSTISMAAPSSEAIFLDTVAKDPETAITFSKYGVKVATTENSNDKITSRRFSKLVVISFFS